ncbi:MAG: DUF1302 family protein [Spirochaetales bacterium]|nr:DUF1302 family protein [Spirochaetales bacterium]
MNKTIFLTFIFLIVISIAGFSLEYKPVEGYIESLIKIPSGWNDDENYQELSTEMQLAVNYVSDRAKLYGAVYFTIDDLIGTGIMSDKLMIKPGEVYLSLYLNKLDITIGHQVISWGTADGLNPTNNINPKDLSDLTHIAASDTKDLIMPVNAVRFNFYPADFLNFEGVFIPLFTPPGMPDFSSYLPPELSGLSDNINFCYPDSAPASFESGMKANFTLPGIDFSLSYLYAWDDIPDIKVNILQQDIGGGMMFGTPASLEFTFNRVHIIGADFAWPLFDIDFRGEAAYFITEDTTGDDVFIKNPYLYYVLGAGYTFFDDLNINLQFSQKIITNYKKISDYDYNIDPMNPASWNQDDSYYEEAYTTQFFPLASYQKGALMSTIMLIIRQNFLDDLLETSFIGMYNFPEDYNDADPDRKLGDFMLKPALKYKFTDAFDIELGANLFFSMKEDTNDDLIRDSYTTFGMIDDKDSFFLKLKYSY